MTPELIAVALGFIETMVKEEPLVAASLKTIFSKPEATPADWAAAKAAVLDDTYGKVVTNTSLPASETGA